ncbi:MAG: hypothetical protein KBC37_06530 [Thermotogae bacterium]|jgi:hypothetical protein|nr:hypothetical protein [Thermotogota bacterium]
MTNDVFHFMYEAYLEVRETAQTHTPRLLAEEAHNGLIRFFMTNDVFHFMYEAYLEVRETAQTQSPRLLAEEAQDG